jgi:Spy/CpxP family protein refolding chaperone
MKKVLFCLLPGFLFMAFASHDSYAETFGPPCNVGKCFHGECMPMMPPMNHPGMERMEGMPEHPMWRHLRDLGLDMQQKALIKEIKDSVMKEMIRSRADEHIAGIELKELLDKDTVDMKAVEMKLKHIETVKTAAHLSFIRAIEEVKSKLKPEQREKFQEMQEMGPNMGPPMSGGMMPPHPCEKKE